MIGGEEHQSNFVRCWRGQDSDLLEPGFRSLPGGLCCRVRLGLAGASASTTPHSSDGAGAWAEAADSSEAFLMPHVSRLRVRTNLLFPAIRLPFRS
mmetsp:Transcript_29980/g.78986  ORF Transcript_29980/g.78986 Transcript_29980/m.78986 type:complete len:96 (-) Transcript_29980:1190-1477(-)